MLVTGAVGLSMSSVVVASEQQISCDVADEAVLLSVSSGDYYGLNPVGASIWRLLQEPRVLTEVRDALLDEYTGIEPRECEHQIIAFVTQMLALEPAPNGSWRRANELRHRCCPMLWRSVAGSASDSAVRLPRDAGPHLLA